MEKFAYFLKQFKPITRQPSDSDLTKIREVVALLLLQIPYYKTGAVHNLIDLIRPDAEYITRYSAVFPKHVMVVAYNPSIDDDAMDVSRTRTEDVHKAKRANRTTYETAQRETSLFILFVVDDTWVRELRDTETLYIDVAPKALLYHLQAGWTARHALNLLDLHNEIQRYELTVKGIPEYINMTKDAQK